MEIICYTDGDKLAILEIITLGLFGRFTMKTLTLRFPDDWHCHLRDAQYLERTVADTCRRFERAIIMPNLSPPVTTLQAARAYRDRILAMIPRGQCFNPLMTLYLTEDILADDIINGQSDAVIFACKLYPMGATTHSASGVTDIEKLYPTLTVMQQQDIPLLIHSESTAPEVDIIHREARFIEDNVAPLLKNFPDLRIVLEHISTKVAVDFVLSCNDKVAATITPHHLLLNLNDLLADGIRPHYYCKPVVNQLADQAALVDAALSGNPKFFLGTDSAPHTQSAKECSVGCAGIYSAHAAIELCAQIFSAHDALDRLENFASCFGANFYGLELNQRQLTLVQKAWQVPDLLTFGNETLVPFFAGKTLDWQIIDENSAE